MNANTASDVHGSTENVSLGLLNQSSSADGPQPSTIGQTGPYQSRRKELVTRLAIMTLVTVALAGAGIISVAYPLPIDKMVGEAIGGNSVVALLLIPLIDALYVGGGIFALVASAICALPCIGLLVLLLLDSLAAAYGKNLPRLCNFLPKIWHFILPQSKG